LLNSCWSLVRLIKSAFRKNPNRFLKHVSGVVHVGASTGQERYLYRKHSLDVVWIEPIPEVFNRLAAHLREFEKQVAFQALVTDVDNEEYTLNISSNDGLSSSIFELKHHRDIWPNVTYVKRLPLRSTTLLTLFKNENIDACKYQALIMDTQGSELLVLRGCGPLLHQFEFIKTEVPDFESYEGCCQLADIQTFMEDHGFREISRAEFARSPGRGSYYDIVFQRVPS
jgi:FkbM family methyltransferase